MLSTDNDLEVGCDERMSMLKRDLETSRLGLIILLPSLVSEKGVRSSRSHQHLELLNLDCEGLPTS